MMNEYIFIDIETTGCRPTLDRIIEIGLYHVMNDEIQLSWQKLINPELSIPYHIQQLTGINQQMVQEAPTFNAIAEELLALISNKIFVAHNARFDYAFIKNAMQAAGYRFHAKTLCTMKLSRYFYPQEKQHNLASLKERFRLTQENSHRALDDVAAMHAIFYRIKLQHPALTFTAALQKITKHPALPQNLPIDLKKKFR